ncbi:MAG TPA: UbiX family flavin prenyltransferase [Candidatus Sumerlaeota bacterium]|nr:UbiX family flavin prenyltransferase [Candidatus Sumerlaeota bacterium]
MQIERVMVGITGASGAIYAHRLLRALALRPGEREILVVASKAGRRVVREELGSELPDTPDSMSAWLGLDPAPDGARWQFFPVEDIGAGPASGSYRLHTMAIVPCSMRTLAAVAGGLADNLITRAADVCLKEGRRLVLAPRECPLNALHLENMLKLARLGVRIVPPMPGFYRGPQSVEDLVQFVVERLMDQMGLTEI